MPEAIAMSVSAIVPVYNGAATLARCLAPQLAGTHLKVWRLGNLVHTEIFGRALPWSRLIHARGSLPNTLNVSASERARAVLAIALGATLFHQVHYLYASAAYAWCWIERRIPPALLRRKASP